MSLLTFAVGLRVAKSRMLRTSHSSILLHSKRSARCVLSWFTGAPRRLWSASGRLTVRLWNGSQQPPPGAVAGATGGAHDALRDDGRPRQPVGRRDGRGSLRAVLRPGCAGARCAHRDARGGGGAARRRPRGAARLRRFRRMRRAGPRRDGRAARRRGRVGGAARRKPQGRLRRDGHGLRADPGAVSPRRAHGARLRLGARAVGAREPHGHDGRARRCRDH